MGSSRIDRPPPQCPLTSLTDKGLQTAVAVGAIASAHACADSGLAIPALVTVGKFVGNGLHVEKAFFRRGGKGRRRGSLEGTELKTAIIRRGRAGG